jgi:hypothetical protein
VDLKLQGNGLAIEKGDLVLVDGKDAIEQHLRIRLKTFKGEWFLDQRVGVPYFQNIFIRAPNLAVVNAIYRKAILSTPGVTGVDSLLVSLDRGTRHLSVSFAAQTADGVISYAEETEI